MATVCTGTPTITVRDNRGQAVRTLRYNRGAVGDVATQLVERSTFNNLGQPVTSQDARFFAGGQGTLNFQNTPALSGQLLQTISADAGTTQAFHDIAGRPIWQRDARGTVQTFTYDALGRPLTRSEQLQGAQTPVVRERRTYGDAQNLPLYDGAVLTDPTDPRNANLCGQLVNHYDTAGLLDTGTWQDQANAVHPIGYTVQGAPQQQGRTLLWPATESNWTGDESGWPAKLESQGYSTTWAYNALGQVLTQTDAKGHQQSTTYDIAGRKSASSVTPKNGKNTPVTTSITYAAGGQILCKVDANGVTTTHTYEVQTTQRLLGIKVTRVGVGTLQNFAYTYDPVGNVTDLADGVMPVTFFRNRAVTPDRTYTYDALYQLIQATGRENDVGTPSGTDSPAAFAPVNTAQYRNYTRTYAYDLGGNLTQIKSINSGVTSVPTRNIVVSNKSNRAISDANAPTPTPAQIGSTYFDPAGNASYLDGNTLRKLNWTGLNQLQAVYDAFDRFGRPGTTPFEEYAYGGDGQRIRKTRMADPGTGYMSKRNDTIYLPGLELRANIDTMETLEVIVLDDGARMLNWTNRPPSDIPNQQIRYRYSDRQDSCQIELDQDCQIITQEEYYPYGGTAVMAAASTSEAKYKTIRYSGKERDAAGLYYYGFRYYQPWIGRWVSTDPAGTVDGLNLYCMVGNNPVTLVDGSGLTRRRPNEDSDDATSSPLKKRRLLNPGKRIDFAQNSDTPGSIASSSRMAISTDTGTAGTASRFNRGEFHDTLGSPSNAQAHFDNLGSPIFSPGSLPVDSPQINFSGPSTPATRLNFKEFIDTVKSQPSIAFLQLMKNEWARSAPALPDRQAISKYFRAKDALDAMEKRAGNVKPEKRLKVEGDYNTTLNNYNAYLKNPDLLRNAENFIKGMMHDAPQEIRPELLGMVNAVAKEFSRAEDAAGKKGFAMYTFQSPKGAFHVRGYTNLSLEPKNTLFYTSAERGDPQLTPAGRRDAAQKLLIETGARSEVTIDGVLQRGGTWYKKPREQARQKRIMERVMSAKGEAGMTPFLHPLTIYDGLRFLNMDTTEADFVGSQERFFAPDQLPALAGFPLSHAEIIARDEALLRHFPIPIENNQNMGHEDYLNYVFSGAFGEEKASQIRETFSQTGSILTLNLTESTDFKRKYVMYFPPCIGCSWVLGEHVEAPHPFALAVLTHTAKIFQEQEGSVTSITELLESMKVDCNRILFEYLPG